MPDNAVTVYEVWIVGRLSDGTAGMAYQRLVAYRRVSAGNAAIVNSASVGDTEEDAGVSAAGIVFTTSTTDALVQVTGIVATTFHWSGTAYQMATVT